MNPSASAKTRGSLALRVAPCLVVLGLALAAACDDSFQPLDPSGQRLSLFGYLDASADTQWIRVNIMRSTIVAAADSAPVKVTLEAVADGRIITLHQATVRFGGAGTVDTGGAVAHNFWTAERIKPGATYRLRAQPATGHAAEVVVAIPADYDMALNIAQPWNSAKDLLELRGLAHVAFVTVTSSYSDLCGSTRETSQGKPAQGTAAAETVGVSRAVNGRVQQGCGSPFVSGRTVWAAGSEAAWPSGEEWSTVRLGGPGPGNVTDGLGFVGGVLTKTIPYEDCTYVQRTATNSYCRLHYDSTSAVLSGTVSDPLCGLRVSRATVQLRELEPKAPEVAKIRSTYTDPAGGYWIGGLVPGMTYAMTVHRSEPPGSIPPEYDDYQATLRFSPGERATRDLDLHRNPKCPTS